MRALSATAQVRRPASRAAITALSQHQPAAHALRLAGKGCHRAKHALGAFYQRIQARAGGVKAVAATARKIAERVCRLLKYGAAYVRQGMEVYEAAYQARLLRGLTRRAQELGFCLVPERLLAGNGLN